MREINGGLRCTNCGFYFVLYATVEDEEYENIVSCPCGDKMDEVEESLDYIPVITL